MRIMTASAKSSLSYFGSAPSDHETAVSALLALDWDLDLAREVGSRLLNYPIVLHIEELGRGEYLIFAYDIKQDAGKSNPTERPIWL